MICDICRRSEASIKFSEIMNDKVIELNLCESCARSKGMHFPYDYGNLSLAEILSGLSPMCGVEKKDSCARQCPSCGSSYKDFQESGRLGCARCYEAFRPQLDPLLKRLHGSSQHVGRISKGFKDHVEDQNTIEKLKQELAAAVKNEEYERAAVIRDQIKEIEKRER